ncbi:MAG TPA: hypothetical protein VHE37_14275, partial [Nevskiaceae bacterium]|nr:hypothetical protein [Nevskiaceae bacterium]
MKKLPASSFVPALAAGVLTLLVMPHYAPAPARVAAHDDGCPAGYEMRDPLAAAREFNERYAEAHENEIRAKFGTQLCMSKLLMPEAMSEAAERQNDAREILGPVPNDAPRRAVEQKAVLQAKAASVPNSGGHWVAYGMAPQVQDDAYPMGSADGITQVSGRTDNFAYDADHHRLFAAVGNGGIWYSEAPDGDVSTLGDHWTSIGDHLPTQINSAVAWTSAAGGRVLVLSGENTQGGNAYVGLGAYWSDDLGQN